MKIDDCTNKREAYLYTTFTHNLLLYGIKHQNNHKIHYLNEKKNTIIMQCYDRDIHIDLEQEPIKE
jgi:hypothetical protein